jgi:DNA-binding PadR family transcriptional regulator
MFPDFFHLAGRGHHGMGRFSRKFGRFGGDPSEMLGMKVAKMLSASDLQLIFLALIKEKPRHGYEIIKEVERESSGVYVPSPGVVYPALTFLEEVGYVTCTVEGTKKLYTITAEGLEHLEMNREAARGILDNLTRLGERLARFKKRMSDEDEAAEHFAEDNRDDRSCDERRKMKHEFMDLRHEIQDVLGGMRGEAAEEKERVFAILRRALDEIRKK